MPIPSELAGACADVALAGDDDVIGGCQARYVAAPASTAEASALLRAAAALGLTVVPRGAGRLQHWGNPPDSCDLIVDTHRLIRIVEHAVAEFTVTTQAGVSTIPITAGYRRPSHRSYWPTKSGSGPRSPTRPLIRERWCAFRFRRCGLPQR
jgi:hypothetical protein